ncbi:MAG: TlpA family protein disulfide reductase [Gammaproteobacteria bacterium]|nr:TlpA family protein disulfide reductase [Gammaproteobacteria bacterium]MDH5591654.1 TlpA family protein disulfide reductase [Gammaproteobacteria bacterium]
MNIAKKYSLIALIVLVGLLAIRSLNNNQQLLPDITFTDIDGEQHSLMDYKGKPILMIFWATDCPGCIQEMPDLIKLHNDFSGQGLTMIGVAMPHDSLDHIISMRQTRELPYIITWDKNAGISQAFDNIRVTPTHFLINPEGEIVMRKIGSLNLNLLYDKLYEMGLTSL